MEQISLRQGRLDDLDYCERLYFSEVKRWPVWETLDQTAHVLSFRQRWDVAQVRMITRLGSDVGYIQTTSQDDALFLAQIFVDSPFQGNGIGTEIMNRLILEAAIDGRPMRLGVVKTNRVLELYKRLGFHITHEDDRKFYMERRPTDYA